MTALRVPELLENWRRAGVLLRAENGNLVVAGKKGALTPEIASEIKLRKADVLAFLVQAAPAAAVAEGDASGAAPGPPADTSDASVVPLRQSGTNLPFFCICGIQLYRPIVNALGEGQPAFGVFVPGEVGVLVDPTADKSLNVPILAAEYIKAIRRQQPRGPFCLGGVSFGGVLAFEIARQLSEQGEEVRLIALFDAVLPRGITFDASSWVAGKLKRLAEGNPWQVIEQRLRRNEQAGTNTRPGTPAEFEAQRDRIYAQAMKDYERTIRPFKGKGVLFRAQDQSAFIGYEIDKSCGWGGLFKGGLDVHNVPGDHIGIISEKYVKGLAKTLRQYLDKASSHP